MLMSSASMSAWAVGAARRMYSCPVRWRVAAARWHADPAYPVCVQSHVARFQPSRHVPPCRHALLEHAGVCDWQLERIEPGNN